MQCDECNSNVLSVIQCTKVINSYRIWAQSCDFYDNFRILDYCNCDLQQDCNCWLLSSFLFDVRCNFNLLSLSSSWWKSYDFDSFHFTAEEKIFFIIKLSVFWPLEVWISLHNLYPTNSVTQILERVFAILGKLMAISQ